MTIRCPACRAENTERTCRRCRADLSLLIDLEASREVKIAAACSALQRADAESALAAARKAFYLRRDADAARLIAAAYLLARRFADALAWHQIAVSDFETSR